VGLARNNPQLLTFGTTDPRQRSPKDWSIIGNLSGIVEPGFIAKGIFTTTPVASIGTWIESECEASGDLHLSHFWRNARSASAGFALFMPRNVRDWLQLIECIVAIYILSRVARYLFYKIVGRL
jgi:hypothetical protein